MKNLILLSLLLFSTACTQVSAPENSIVFTNVNVLTMTDNTVLENRTVIIEGDRITQIIEGSVSTPESATVINGTGKYLMPGLGEMHGHVPPINVGVNDDYVESTLFLYTAAGITTVRGMLGTPGQLALKDRVNNGELVGPNLYLAGPSFNGNSVSSPEQAEQKVRDQKNEGWDLLKVHPGLTLAEYDAMASTAHEVGITFGGHIPADVGLEHALDMRQETIDHVDGYVIYLTQFEGEERSQKMAEIIERTKEQNVWIVPTMALWETIIGAGDYDHMKAYDELKYIPQNVKDNYFNFATNIVNNPNVNREEALEHAELRTLILSEMNKAGVKIMMGTDAPQLFSVPGFSIHRELQSMVDANMTPYEIIRSGTYMVGEYFADKANFGTIEVGKRADLILVNSNPLDDVSNIKDHSGVMVQGKWQSRASIDQRLKEIEEQYSSN